MADPTEATPLASGSPDVDQLSLRLDRFLEGARRLPTPRPDEVMDPETAERLRALGYGD